MTDAAASPPPTRPPGPVVIGLDVGTSGAKAAAFAPGTRWRAVAERDYLGDPATGGEDLQDPARVVEAAEVALAEVVAACAGAEVRAVALSAAMHGLVGLDGAGRPVTPLSTWADGRANNEALELRQGPHAAALRQATGLWPHPMTPLAKLRFLARHDPDAFASARHFGGLKELLVLRLTGTLATEVSSASATGLLDLKRCEWSPLALELCGIEVDRLAPVRPTTAVLPLARAAAGRLGLAPGTPVVLGAADGPLANLGARALSPGVAGLSLGTSAALRRTVEGVRLDATGALFCYALAEPTWVVGGALSNGAGLLRWAAGAFLPDLAAALPPGGLDEAVLALAGEVEPGAGGVAVLPFILPERDPLWAADLAGTVVGLGPGHTRAHLVRAAMEGVCLQLRLLLERVERAGAADGLGPLEEVRATGGAFRSPLWRDLVAAALGRPLVLADDAAGTALGAAALGLLALGDTADLAAARAALEPPGRSAPAPVPARPELVEAAERLRQDLGRRLGALGSLDFLEDRPVR